MTRRVRWDGRKCADCGHAWQWHGEGSPAPYGTCGRVRCKCVRYVKGGE